MVVSIPPLLPILLLLSIIPLIESFHPYHFHHHHHHHDQQQHLSKIFLPSSKTLSSLPLTTSSEVNESTYDVIVIGSGIGGLSSAAMLSLYGYNVAVFEAHYEAGGCAHGFEVPVPKNKNIDNDYESSGDGDGGGGSDMYRFDTGPSFFSGLNTDLVDASSTSNPLRTILDAVDEKVECKPYQTFGLLFPEGNFIHTNSFGRKGGTLEQLAVGRSSSSSSTSILQKWSSLMNAMKPLAQAVDALPTAALRADIGVLLTAAPFLPNFAKGNPFNNLKLVKSFGTVLDDVGISKSDNEGEEKKKDDDATFARNWLDLLCFCLSGLPADGTITAEMAMMMGEFYDEDAIMDQPIGGAKAIVDALVNGVEKNGGKIFLNSFVEKVNIVDGRAVGVTLRGRGGGRGKGSGGKKGKICKTIRINAKKAVISNLSGWDLLNIVDRNELSEQFIKEKKETPVGKSFMHIHVGFQMPKMELEQLQAHYMYMDDWSRGVDAQDNAALLSIPSVHDETLAPKGHAVLHIYTPATEDYSQWIQFEKEDYRKSKAYNVLKGERSQFLWNVLEKVIPDIRERATVVKVGTPLTHKRYLRRHRGTYGPAIRADEGSFPFPGTPVKGLLLCGDSCFPGIGVPAVAASGLLAANSVSFDSIKPQLELLKNFKK